MYTLCLILGINNSNRMKFVKCLCDKIIIAKISNTTTVCCECYYQGLSFSANTVQDEVTVSQIRHKLDGIVKDFHNCPLLMTEKKHLESFVRRSNNLELIFHFKTKFYRRKYWFYLKIIQDILFRQKRKGSYTSFKLRQDIDRTTRRILYIYDKKLSEKHHLKGLLKAYEDEEEERYARADQYEEYQSAIMEDWSYYDC